MNISKRHAHTIRTGLYVGKMRSRVGFVTAEKLADPYTANAWTAINDWIKSNHKNKLAMKAYRRAVRYNQDGAK